MLLFHFVEEPARRWMRKMVDFRDVKGGPRALPKGSAQGDFTQRGRLADVG